VSASVASAEPRARRRRCLCHHSIPCDDRRVMAAHAAWQRCASDARFADRPCRAMEIPHRERPGDAGVTDDARRCRASTQKKCFLMIITAKVDASRLRLRLRGYSSGQRLLASWTERPGLEWTSDEICGSGTSCTRPWKDPSVTSPCLFRRKVWTSVRRPLYAICHRSVVDDILKPPVGMSSRRPSSSGSATQAPKAAPYGFTGGNQGAKLPLTSDLRRSPRSHRSTT
jgi:hypothetical protein